MSGPKRCTSCGTTEPEEFYASGRSRCKECIRARARAYHHAHKDEQNQRRSNHYRSATAEKRAERIAKRAGAQDRKRAKYERDREAILAQKKEYYAAKREEILQQKREAYDPARARAKNQAAYRADPARYSAYRDRRRARARSARGSYSASDVRSQLERQKGYCFWCKERLGKDWEADHVTPLSRGGDNSPGNIVIACRPCNRRKSAKLPADFGGVLM